MKYNFRDVELLHPYPLKGGENEIKLIGIDSEAYVTGEPFLFCFSDGRSCHAKDIFGALFSGIYEGCKFVVWNLKYEQGALFYFLPVETLQTLREFGRATYGEYTISIIENKEVKISYKHHARYVYDVYPYYGSSLEAAASCYLGKHKIKSTKKFRIGYVTKHIARITEYCTMDAQLTKELGDLFVDNLHRLKLYPKKLISTGYISAQHFTKIHNSNIYSFYYMYPDAVRFAFDSYSGGMFQVFKRGKGYFYQYDINSAYPSSIAKLKSLEGAEVIRSREIPRHADYGFLDCEMIISSQFSPVAVKVNNLNIYPQGYVRRIITLSEYHYLKSQGNDIEVKDAWFISCQSGYPYKKEIERLYKLKSEYKGNDDMQYLLIKILLNSLYGKFLQVTEIYDKNNIKHWRAGMLFNPIYASYITALTRVKLCEAMDTAPDSVCAAHTDSIISDNPLTIPMSSDLGAWNFIEKGKGYIVGSGIYSIGGRVHFRGFDREYNLDKMIRDARKAKINITQKMARTWRYALFTHSDINVFEDDLKVLDLNFDNKRMWDAKFNKNKIGTSNPIILLK